MTTFASKIAAENVGKPVKTAPGGQPKVAPGPVAHSNATSVPSAKAKQDTAPESGAKGQTDKGTLAMSKQAGFNHGLSMAMAEHQKIASEDEVDENGFNPDVIAALEVLSANGIEVEFPEGIEKEASYSAVVKNERAKPGNKTKATLKGLAKDIGAAGAGSVVGGGLGYGAGALLAANAIKRKGLSGVKADSAKVMGRLLGLGTGAALGGNAGMIASGVHTYKKTPKNK